MSDAEFLDAARAALKKVAGATNGNVVATASLLGVSCVYRGEQVEISIERRAKLDANSKSIILGAIGRLGQP